MELLFSVHKPENFKSDLISLEHITFQWTLQNSPFEIVTKDLCDSIINEGRSLGCLIIAHIYYIIQPVHYKCDLAGAIVIMSFHLKFLSHGTHC